MILVGGATRMPQVVDRVTDLLGKPPQRRLNPDEVVALGAAVQAGLIAQPKGVDDLVVTDVAPFTLGVEIAKDFGHERRDGYFLPVIDRNTTIPVSRSQRVGTVDPEPDRDQGARSTRAKAGGWRTTCAWASSRCTAFRRGPAGQEVDIRFTYDLNGVLEVEATVVETSQTVSHVVTRHAQGLSPEQMKTAVREMAKLKTHPREEQANRSCCGGRNGSIKNCRAEHERSWAGCWTASRRRWRCRTRT